MNVVRNKNQDGQSQDHDPSMRDQVFHWNAWVARSKEWENGRDNQRRRKHVLENVRSALTRCDDRPAFLDIACGTGWLARELSRIGDVTALDLAGDIMGELRKTSPHITWLAGDFLEMSLDCQYDVVTCLEAISSVSDQATFVKRIANVTKRGGTMIMTTQNPYVWNRTSTLAPRGTGQVRRWIPRHKLVELVAPYFQIVKLGTCAPSGDRGLLRLFNNRMSVKLAGLLVGRETWVSARERLGLGCSLVLVATRR
jgi:2-polyprenyl-3-methyl-5-hydroxy-6-metoxy-1,4-benzoquinol methylase